VGQNLSPDELADKIGVSRAALYRLEKGMIVKIETVARVASLLNVSLASLLGVGVEYYDNALAFFERSMQIERGSMRVRGNFAPISQIFVSDDYPIYLREMILESLPEALFNRRTIAIVDKILEIMGERRKLASARQTPVVSIVNAQDIERMLRFGLVGRFGLPVGVIKHRRLAAQNEVAHLIRLIAQQPIGSQIGVLDDVPPTQTFHLFEGLDSSYVALSPFRMSDHPNVLVGVAMVTSAPEAVALFKNSFNSQWEKSHKGSKAIALLREILARTSNAERNESSDVSHEAP
jgi:transcriptional regulator with XRE-family HTH domain